METIRSIVWWQSIQYSDLTPDKCTTVKSLLKLCFLQTISIENIKKMISSKPIEVNLSNINFKKMMPQDGHSVVGETLYQDINDSSVYYLGIYDCNYPGNEEYIKIKKNQYLCGKIFKYTLKFKTERINYQDRKIFCSTNIDAILKGFKK